MEGIVQDCQNDEDGVHAGQSDEELVEGVVHVRLRQDDDAQDVADQTHRSKISEQCYDIRSGILF